MELYNRLFEPIRQITEGHGCRLIELSNGEFPGSIRVVIYKEQGIKHSDCDQIAKLIRNNLNDFSGVDVDSLSFEIASPGIYRKIKNVQYELPIFNGKNVVLYLSQKAKELDGIESVELNGSLVGVAGNVVELNSSRAGTVKIPIELIVSAKLQG